MNPFYSISPKSGILQQSLRQNHGTIRMFLNRNKESQSLLILSSSNCFRMGPFNHVKHHNVINQSIKKNTLITIKNSSGPLGTATPISNFYSFLPLLTYNQISLIKYFQLDNLKYIFQKLTLI